MVGAAECGIRERRQLQTSSEAELCPQQHLSLQSELGQVCSQLQEDSAPLVERLTFMRDVIILDYNPVL